MRNDAAWASDLLSYDWRDDKVEDPRRLQVQGWMEGAAWYSERSNLAIAAHALCRACITTGQAIATMLRFLKKLRSTVDWLARHALATVRCRGRACGKLKINLHA